MHLKTLALLFLIPLLVGCGGGGEAPSPKSAVPEGAVVIGQELTRTEPVTLATVQSAPETYFEQTILVAATAESVCQSMGCWMTVREGEGEIVWVRWGEGCGGEFAFPKDIAGKRVLLEGSIYPKEISEEDAEHIAEESGGMTAEEIAGKAFEINATACVILPGAEESAKS
ncbi:MAG: DUF4920 domain-containing protein [Gemmatimonadota bacterium]|nr:hypothetical protein [Gemmatimonadota bacterium]MDP6461767.1 DUF4920 domain-containing protein [Gemmatimonadota bacterium]MDP6529236.1 DUF4920 domain-containing protein [Gemmatimonadota bacterium]MDP6802897.1 DUF4920 domain-containing protein [Gemmatimonadota bacterium]MDP7031433.1 DUF4920 domain-containing protein [Gemmatimonadota bacterium]